MEFLVGGVSASCAALFTNPLEVVKTRMQLQVFNYTILSNFNYIKFII